MPSPAAPPPPPPEIANAHPVPTARPAAPASQQQQQQEAMRKLPLQFIDVSNSPDTNTLQTKTRDGRLIIPVTKEEHMRVAPEVLGYVEIAAELRGAVPASKQHGLAPAQLDNLLVLDFTDPDIGKRIAYHLGAGQKIYVPNKGEVRRDPRQGIAAETIDIAGVGLSPEAKQRRVMEFNVLTQFVNYLGLLNLTDEQRAQQLQQIKTQGGDQAESLARAFVNYMLRQTGDVYALSPEENAAFAAMGGEITTTLLQSFKAGRRSDLAQQPMPIAADAGYAAGYGPNEFYEMVAVNPNDPRCQAARISTYLNSLYRDQDEKPEVAVIERVAQFLQSKHIIIQEFLPNPTADAEEDEIMRFNRRRDLLLRLEINEDGSLTAGGKKTWQSMLKRSLDHKQGKREGLTRFDEGKTICSLLTSEPYFIPQGYQFDIEQDVKPVLREATGGRSFTLYEHRATAADDSVTTTNRALVADVIDIGNGDRKKGIDQIANTVLAILHVQYARGKPRELRQNLMNINFHVRFGMRDYILQTTIDARRRVPTIQYQLTDPYPGLRNAEGHRHVFAVVPDFYARLKDSLKATTSEKLVAAVNGERDPEHAEYINPPVIAETVSFGEQVAALGILSEHARADSAMMVSAYLMHQVSNVGGCTARYAYDIDGSGNYQNHGKLENETLANDVTYTYAAPEDQIPTMQGRINALREAFARDRLFAEGQEEIAVRLRRVANVVYDHERVNREQLEELMREREAQKDQYTISAAQLTKYEFDPHEIAGYFRDAATGEALGNVVSQGDANEFEIEVHGVVFKQTKQDDTLTISIEGNDVELARKSPEEKAEILRTALQIFYHEYRIVFEKSGGGNPFDPVTGIVYNDVHRSGFLSQFTDEEVAEAAFAVGFSGVRRQDAVTPNPDFAARYDHEDRLPEEERFERNPLAEENQPEYFDELDIAHADRMTYLQNHIGNKVDLESPLIRTLLFLLNRHPQLINMFLENAGPKTISDYIEAQPELSNDDANKARRARVATLLTPEAKPYIQLLAQGQWDNATHESRLPAPDTADSKFENILAFFTGLALPSESVYEKEGEQSLAALLVDGASSYDLNTPAGLMRFVSASSDNTQLVRRLLGGKAMEGVNGRRGFNPHLAPFNADAPTLSDEALRELVFTLRNPDVKPHFLAAANLNKRYCEATIEPPTLVALADDFCRDVEQLASGAMQRINRLPSVVRAPLNLVTAPTSMLANAVWLNANERANLATMPGMQVAVKKLVMGPSMALMLPVLAWNWTGGWALSALTGQASWAAVSSSAVFSTVFFNPWMLMLAVGLVTRFGANRYLTDSAATDVDASTIEIIDETDRTPIVEEVEDDESLASIDVADAVQYHEPDRGPVVEEVSSTTNRAKRLAIAGAGAGVGLLACMAFGPAGLAAALATAGGAHQLYNRLRPASDVAAEDEPDVEFYDAEDGDAPIITELNDDEFFDAVTPEEKAEAEKAEREAVATAHAMLDGIGASAGVDVGAVVPAVSPRPTWIPSAGLPLSAERLFELCKAAVAQDIRQVFVRSNKLPDGPIVVDPHKLLAKLNGNTADPALPALLATSGEVPRTATYDADTREVVVHTSADGAAALSLTDAAKATPTWTLDTEFPTHLLTRASLEKVNQMINAVTAANVGHVVINSERLSSPVTLTKAAFLAGMASSRHSATGGSERREMCEPLASREIAHVNFDTGKVTVGVPPVAVAVDSDASDATAPQPGIVELPAEAAGAASPSSSPSSSSDSASRKPKSESLPWYKRFGGMFQRQQSGGETEHQSNGTGPATNGSNPKGPVQS